MGVALAVGSGALGALALGAVTGVAIKQRWFFKWPEDGQRDDPLSVPLLIAFATIWIMSMPGFGRPMAGISLFYGLGVPVVGGAAYYSVVMFHRVDSLFTRWPGGSWLGKVATLVIVGTVTSGMVVIAGGVVAHFLGGLIREGGLLIQDLVKL